MFAMIKNHNKSIKRHRLLFLLYCITVGLLANLSVVTIPIAVPLNVGNVAILVILARLGPLWALVCFAFVTYPLPSDIAIILTFFQAMLFGFHINQKNSSIIKISTAYFIIVFVTNKILLPEAITDNSTSLLIFTSLSTALFIWTIKAANLLLALYVNNEQLRKQSLQHQLSFRVGLYTAIPATLLITLGLNGITNLHLVKQMTRYQNEVNDLKENIELKLKDYSSKIETIAKLTDIVVTKSILMQLVKQSPEFISALITDANGTVNKFYKEDISDDNLGKMSVTDRAYYYEAKNTMSTYISDTFTGRSLGEDQLFAVSTPIINNNQFNGVLQLAIKLDSLLEVFNLPNDSISHRILIDNSGKKVWGNNISGDVGSIWIRPKHSEAMQKTFLENSLFNPLEPIIFSRDAHHLIVSNQVGLTDWKLYFFIDTDELILDFSIYYLLSLLLITLILEISVQLSKRFVKHYTQALELLVDYTQQWDGKSTTKKNLNFTQSALEIDTLAHSFVNMQRRVAGAHHAIISTMNEVKLLNEALEERVEKRTKELEHERDKANQLAAVKTRFLANMSHEIRTPITIIRGFAEQILPNTQGEVHNALCKIEQHTLHLQNVINDILDAAKIDEGKMTIAEQTVAIIPLLNSLSDSMKVLAKTKKLTTELNIDIADIEHIITDPFRLKQILLNFISNAVKFTPKGTVKLVANITNKDELCIAVIDEGIGISDQQASTLFEAFTQADSSTSRDFGGTGLGLFISKQLADAMSIKLHMQSELGVGSCFSVTLPESKIVKNLTEFPKNEKEIEHTIPDWKNYHILIVDDVDDIRELIDIYLKDTEIAVDFAQNGQQAIQLVEKSHYDLVILDQQMPIMDGLTAAKAIREFNKSIPLLLLSADIIDTETHQTSPFNKTIAKPFTKNQLIETIRLFIVDNSISTKNVNEEDENELTREYLHTLPKVLLLLEQLVKCEERAHLEHELHKLKGTSACLGLIAISHCAASLHNLLKERMIKLNELDDISLAVKNALKETE